MRDIQNAGNVANLTTGIGNAKAGSILGVQGIDNNLFSGLRSTVGAATGLPTLGGSSGGLGSILGSSGGIGSLLGSLFGGAGGSAQGAGGTLSGSFPSIIGASNNPLDYGTLNTSSLIQKIGF